MRKNANIKSRKPFFLALIGGVIGISVLTIAAYVLFGAGYDLNPSLSPDGEVLVYECYKPSLIELLTEGTKYYGDIPYQPASTEICTVDSDGHNQQRLTKNRFDDQNPVWSPDSEKIAFVSNRDGSIALYLMDPDGSNQRKIASASSGTDIAWSPDSKRIAISRYDYSINNGGGLYIIDLVTGAERQLSREQVSNIAWSPDGNVLAFVVGSEDGCAVHIVESETVKPISNPLASACSSIAWSPSGADLAFVRVKTDIEKVLMVLNLQTQTVVQLPVEGNLLESTLLWSPNSDSVYYLTSKNRMISIEEVNKSSSQQRTIVENQRLLVHRGERNFLLSPDGKQLIFVLGTGRNNNAQIWKKIIDGTGQIKLSR